MQLPAKEGQGRREPSEAGREAGRMLPGASRRSQHTHTLIPDFWLLNWEKPVTIV